ncbi:MAG: TetR/AcrR family transcriptional regulator [Phocaeicola vulgatus]
MRAGVTHAMLHYYFRTKENLFNKVFEEKARQLADTFLSRVDESLPFLEKIKCFIEAHPDLLTANTLNYLYLYAQGDSEPTNAEKKFAAKPCSLPLPVSNQSARPVTARGNKEGHNTPRQGGRFNGQRHFTQYLCLCGKPTDTIVCRRKR